MPCSTPFVKVDMEKKIIDTQPTLIRLDASATSPRKSILSTGSESTASPIEHGKAIVYKGNYTEFMKKKQALCIKKQNKVIGVLLFSRNRNMICCLAVSPEYRKQGIASRLLKKALSELDRGRNITVSTFCENDEKGIAPRALYKKFGFEEGEFTREYDYPNQVFILRA